MHKNQGSVTVEASLVVPLFLFFFLTVIRCCGMMMAEAYIHQSLAEAACETAQYCYVIDREAGEKASAAASVSQTVYLQAEFQKILGTVQCVEETVAGGSGGILVCATPDSERSAIFYARAEYCLRLPIPVLGTYSMRRENVICQKAFLGYDPTEEVDAYVFLTPNQEVYHLRRDCTHLMLTVTSASGTGGLPPCRYCGKRKTGKYYIAKDGRAYHTTRNCSGLKRTVSRVKKEQAAGLGCCERCGR